MVTKGDGMTADHNALNIKGDISMNMKEIVIVTKEMGVHDWLLNYLREPSRGRYGCISAANRERFNAYVSKPETVMLFLEVDFFGNDTVGMLECLKKCRPELRVILFSVYKIPAEDVAHYLWWGAETYFFLRNSENEIKAQIKILLEGGRFLPDDLQRHVEEYGRLPFKPPYLTHREIEIVRCIAKGLVKKEIAAALRLSKKTVDNHIANIYRKFGMHNSVGVLKLAVSKGLLSDNDIVYKPV
jgi:DNA-binding NarL/FixJ family response regulator